MGNKQTDRQTEIDRKVTETILTNRKGERQRQALRQHIDKDRQAISMPTAITIS